MSLEERRQKLLENTLNEVNNSLAEILKILQKDRPIEFIFKAGETPDLTLSLKSECGTINSGYLLINRPNKESSRHEVLSFPLLFVHQICLKCHTLRQQIVYTIHNYKRCTLQSIESFLSMASQAIAILSDPKFMKIPITNYFEPPLPPDIELDIFFQNGNAKLLYSPFNNLEAGSAKNVEDETFLVALEGILLRIIHSLKYLRSDVITWAIPADE
ncbi:hypothetical protein TVAG_472670 [Trichomonas vaginalis G3]|uniref:Uncharacterized protein n=1 Tax=Trichomonas vaginalis (strain ATCC PRA-98 / G3) TaxID=412133 RepID=A2FU94_TRIV3|nr:hypothetical protein TVAGG3_0448000 [Trichomonas vaginalis G3]EAX91525.1 hypothetical protein TVAG_472670 [Trichomonas vaginalis G3]KAI5537947.1 hypothetical protein TVAGG3_0448000 [Trichomonas vaginalis G3]|eukprot:XP_001304455.1 hypothetical protein [Trichomonas vaginalis G3]